MRIGAENDGTSIGCKELAEWTIHPSSDPRNYTYACTAHVGEMLDDSPMHHISPYHQGNNKIEKVTCCYIPEQSVIDFEHKLRNLLAVIHRDGGHYVSAHGLDKACEDAERLVAEGHSAAEPRPDSCPTCGSLDPAKRFCGGGCRFMADAW